MTQNKSKVNIVAVVTMCFIFAMISFVTNMAAPFGNIWKGAYPWAAMMGNLMNFAAYLFMGIPAGKMLLKIGYKKTTLVALAAGFFGIVIQWLSSFPFVGSAAIFVYLAGAFVCGLCVCMLNTVVNPMLNILGGGGNRGNQFIQIGGTLNSLTGTLTPMLIGALIGTVTKSTTMGDVEPLLFIAMGVFLVSFLIIAGVKIPEPAQERTNVKFEHKPLDFRHLKLGVIAIFFYVGIEVGIPAELNLFLSETGTSGAGILINGALIGGAFYGAYFFLMLCGRLLGTVISKKVSTKTQLTAVSALGIVLILLAIFIPKSVGMKAPSLIYNPEKETVSILVSNDIPEEDAQNVVKELQGLLANGGSILLEEQLVPEIDPAEYNEAPEIAEEAPVVEEVDAEGPVYPEEVGEADFNEADFVEAEFIDVDPMYEYEQEVREDIDDPDAPENAAALMAFMASPSGAIVSDHLDGIAESLNINVDETPAEELPMVVAEMLSNSLDVPTIPLSALFLILCGLCTSIMWGGIFNLAVEGLGKYTEAASGIFMTMVVGGGVMPFIQHNVLALNIGYLASYWLVIAMLAYILYYALVGCKNVNKDIPVD